MAMDQSGRLVLGLYCAAREMPIPDFQEHALSLFKSLCLFDSSMWGVGEMHGDTGLTIESVHLHNLPEEVLASYEDVKERDLVAIEAFAPRRLGTVCNFNLRDMMPGAQYAAVASFDKRWGFQNLLGETVYDDTLGSVDFIALWRAKERDRYTEENRLLAEALLPHLIEAGTINRLLWLNQMAGAVLVRRGARAIANRSGVLQTCGGEFFDVLRKEWPEWSPPALPRALFDGLRGSSERQFIGRRISVAALLTNGMVFLRATERRRVDDLTKAQLAVAKRVANGLSYKEVARELSLSPATVRNHLHSAYVKLDVSNKAALARCLFDAW